MSLRAVIIVCGIICITCAFFLFNGCAVRPLSGVREGYRDAIKGWQKTIIDEGWSHSLADEIAIKTRQFSKYKESGYKWYSPNSFLYQEMKGDCLEIAAQMLATFTFLEYPYGKRVRIVCPLMSPFFYHAVFRYEWPQGEWHQVETTPAPKRTQTPGQTAHQK